MAIVHALRYRAFEVNDSFLVIFVFTRRFALYIKQRNVSSRFRKNVFCHTHHSTHRPQNRIS